ncbi:MAG TPA: response regulator transcription factor [Solirubrobacterales bacterium]|nr:response regulator transcription factor [Solirubrobacterales bacterium]
MTPIKVLLVDDDALVRSGLRMMLGGDPSIRIVGEASDGSEVAAAVDGHRPDVVLMDIRMPEVDGLTATRRLRSRPNPPEVIVLTTFDADEMIFSALRHGAAGFLLKDTPPADILRAIQLVAAGEAMLSPTVTRQLLDHFSTGEDGGGAEAAKAAIDSLTDREREVAVAVGRGCSNQDIADELFMSVATVKGHVTKLLSKLDADNRVQIALKVRDAGLT